MGLQPLQRLALLVEQRMETVFVPLENNQTFDAVKRRTILGNRAIVGEKLRKPVTVHDFVGAALKQQFPFLEQAQMVREAFQVGKVMRRNEDRVLAIFNSL